MNVDEIKNLSGLIRLSPDKKIKSYKVKRLTAPGENYGSLMLRVDISVEGTDGIEEIHAVAKMVPPNPYIQKVFNTQVTFRNEIALYKVIVPLLQDFQREHGIRNVVDFAAEYYGSRLNLSNDDEGNVDSDGALVLENLISSGYDMLDRIKGLDLDAAKLVLRNLAEFHAVPLALKIKKPEIFDKKIRPYLHVWQLDEESMERIRQDHSDNIDQIEELRPLKERILDGFDRLLKDREYPIREPFATVVHNDCWTNNNMFKLEGAKVVKSKMVDYQILSYGSPARDVVFFIFSSLQNETIRDNYEELLKFYYDTFVNTLQELDCETSNFTFEAFQKEINIEAVNTQFGHVAFMLLPIYAPKGTAKELDEMKPEDMKTQEISKIQKEKIVFVYNEFAKRGWI